MYKEEKQELEEKLKEYQEKNQNKRIETGRLGANLPHEIEIYCIGTDRVVSS